MSEYPSIDKESLLLTMRNILDIVELEPVVVASILKGPS